MKSYILLVAFFLSVSAAYSQDFVSELRLHRETYVKELVEDGPLKEEDASFVDFYAPNEAFRVKCTFKATKKGAPFAVPTSAGTTKEYAKFGELSFKVNKKKYKLAVYQSMALLNNPFYKDYLFVPFKDLTNGKETYGGGRYLDLRMNEIEGNNILLDFNKAYNPYCAFASGYSCPIPPAENQLKVAIEAGEKTFKKEHP